MLIRKLIILSGLDIDARGILKVEAMGGEIMAYFTAGGLPFGKYVIGFKSQNMPVQLFPLPGERAEIKLDPETSLEGRLECIVADSEDKRAVMYGSNRGAQPDKSAMLDGFFPKEEPIIAAEHAEYTENKPKARYYDKVKSELELLFKNNPADPELCKSVPESKWVRVNYDQGKYYAVGVLYNSEGATHVCYGIPGTYDIRPDSETRSEWLPVSPEDWKGKGYWVIFQSAETGEVL